MLARLKRRGLWVLLGLAGVGAVRWAAADEFLPIANHELKEVVGGSACGWCEWYNGCSVSFCGACEGEPGYCSYQGTVDCARCDGTVTEDRLGGVARAPGPIVERINIYDPDGGGISWRPRRRGATFLTIDPVMSRVTPFTLFRFEVAQNAEVLQRIAALEAAERSIG